MRLTLDSSDCSLDAIALVAAELKARGVPLTLVPNGMEPSLCEDHVASFDVSIPTEESLTALCTVLAKTSQSATIKIMLNGVDFLARGEEEIRKSICLSIYSSSEKGGTPDELPLTERDLRDIEKNGRSLNALLDSIDAI